MGLVYCKLNNLLLKYTTPHGRRSLKYIDLAMQYTYTMSLIRPSLSSAVFFIRKPALKCTWVSNYSTNPNKVIQSDCW